MINIFNIFIFILILIGFIIYLIKKLKIKNLNLYIKKNFIIKNILYNFHIILIIFLIRWFIYEPFKIPSSSMMPTLLIGDFILVNKLKYNIKNPFTNNTILNIGKPNYGDLIVFQYPFNKKINYIKRVIGLPGDKIIYNYYKNKLKIYKYCKNKKKFCKKNIIKYSKKKISNFIEEIKYNNKNYIEENFINIKQNNNNNFKNKKNSKFIFLVEKYEYIKNKKYKILTILNIHKNIKYYNKINKFIWIVPKNMYFVLGDYRDNSDDSRYWGFLDEKLIIGKAEFIWLSFEKKKNFLPINIRIERIGKII